MRNVCINFGDQNNLHDFSWNTFRNTQIHHTHCGRVFFDQAVHDSTAAAKRHGQEV